MYWDKDNPYKQLEQSKKLKSKIKIENDKITLKVHDHFIINHIGNNIYINNKLYDDIEDQDLLEIYCDLLENNDYIYVQYKHLHLMFNSGLRFSYLKAIKRNKFFFLNLRHKEDIDLIFDNQMLIYDSKKQYLTNEWIIDFMYKESLQENYIKVYYSLDKMKRLIIIKNSINSYSYNIEELTIFDTQEIVMYKKYAIWEQIIGKNISYYESLELLLNDIQAEISEQFILY